MDIARLTVTPSFPALSKQLPKQAQMPLKSSGEVILEVNRPCLCKLNLTM